MDIEKFKELADGWKAATEKVLKLESLDCQVLSKLFLETYSIIKEYCHEDMVPKELFRVLWEMNDFSWWVSSLVDTPINILYQEITSLVISLHSYLLSGTVDELDIQYHIEKIDGAL